ncbi:hypothetical protein EW146_g8824 [Bondarzewia mesenterica]|uniref:Chromo domain-containing protein n=1 Tax=Bondarzewia mesenterica TaxID=1095465 RepID=A0A4S4LBE9_9AGAM|nr:hypothetical protein EW146_g8824 [Bondarzewia mesenterica]
MCTALRKYIRKICHVYLDDIIIWSQMIEEHTTNISLILQALHDAHLYCSPKKTSLFCWTPGDQQAFDAIKQLVIGRECLTTIDHDNPGPNNIYVTCDASDWRTGATLSWGPTWETARPVAFDSTQLSGPALNYPVHEQELLAIIRALKKWRCDLLGMHFIYIPGPDNTVADALSRLPPDSLTSSISPTSTISTIPTPTKLLQNLDSFPNAHLNQDGFLFLGSCLIIPCISAIRELLFQAAHNALGHFSAEKSYLALRDSYYWPGMHIRLVPTNTDITAERFAALFFEHWFCHNGLPDDIVSDREKLFTSSFWTTFNRLCGVRLKISSSYHPQTDSSSECTNKSIIQALRLLPPLPLFSSLQTPDYNASAHNILAHLHTNSRDALDNLLTSKITQAHHSNHSCAPDPHYQIGDRVLLSTFHRRRDYTNPNEHRVAKFMPRYDGPYRVTRANPEKSTYTLDLPNSPQSFPTFYSSLLRPFHPNDDLSYPSRTLHRLPPILGPDGQEEWTINEIIDEHSRGCRRQYLVTWKGWGDEDSRWLPAHELSDCAALDHWEFRLQSTSSSPEPTSLHSDPTLHASSRPIREHHLPKRFHS